MHDLYILVGLIGGVETIFYVATVGVVVAEFNGVYIRSLSHDVLSKMLTECRNDMDNIVI